MEDCCMIRLADAVVTKLKQEVHVSKYLSVLMVAAFVCCAQEQPPPTQLLNPNQLDNLVAPIALYPDPPQPDLRGCDVSTGGGSGFSVDPAKSRLDRSGPHTGCRRTELGSQLTGSGGFPRCLKAPER